MLAADIHYQMASHLTATGVHLAHTANSPAPWTFPASRDHALSAGALDAVIPEGCHSLVSSITASHEAPRSKAASCCSF